MIRKSDLQQMPWPDLLEPLLTAAPTPREGPASRYSGDALAQELDVRLQQLAEASGLRVLTLEEQRHHVIDDVKHKLLTRAEVDNLRTLSDPDAHIKRLLRRGAIDLLWAASRPAP